MLVTLLRFLLAQIFENHESFPFLFTKYEQLIPAKNHTKNTHRKCAAIIWDDVKVFKGKQYTIAWESRKVNSRKY